MVGKIRKAKINKKKSLATGIARNVDFSVEIKQLLAGMGVVNNVDPECINLLNDLVIHFIKNCTKEAMKHMTGTVLDGAAVLKALSYDAAKHDQAQYIMQQEEIGKPHRPYLDR
ncbi:uncharacterized protein LOC119687002 [Teleopsis dalmanni]|uniref:uncharacterized protein LOC119687002 n=1 Tax=Teleopsis dalmanni TaxID=139649 RepID=UPI000D32B1C3|nr:uncharacterized protein LOC119687002 [Teleopsis dalmanni]